MSPIYNTGGGAAASNSVAATKEETPTGTKIMRGGFNNDTGADDKSLSVSTTPRTDLSALSPISRYYCRRNWYIIDINGYHQFQTSYDKIVINNKDNNNSNNVTAPKERVPDNTNEEQEDSELNNQDVNNDYGVIITPETTPRREGVLKVRDRSKSNTTSVATTKNKNMPTGPNRMIGGFENDTGNRKSTTYITTKSNLSAQRNNDTVPRKEGVSATGQREIGKRFNNDASTGNENSLPVTAPRTNLSSYIESNKYYCTSYEGNKKNVPTGEKRTRGIKNNAGNKKSTTSIITKSNRSSPPLHNNTTPRKEGVPKEHNSSEPYKDNNTPPCKEGVPITRRCNNNKEQNITINNEPHRKERVGFIWYEQVPRLNTKSWTPVIAGVDSINNKKIVMPSSQFVTSTHNAYAVLSENDDDDDDDVYKLNSPISLLKQKENDNFFDNSIASKEGVVPTNKERANEIRADGYNYDTINNTVVPSKEGVVKNKDDTTHGHPFKNGVSEKQTNVAQSNTDKFNSNTIVHSKEGVVPTNKESANEIRADGYNYDTINTTVVPSEDGVVKNKDDTHGRPNNTDNVRHGSSNSTNRNRSDNEDNTVFHPPDNNNKINPSNKRADISKSNKEHTDEIKMRTDDEQDINAHSEEEVNTIDHSKEGVRKIAVRSDDTNDNVNKHSNKGVGDGPSNEGVWVVDECHDNTSDCTPVPDLQGLRGDDWSSIDSDSIYDDGEYQMIQPVDNEHSKKRVSRMEQSDTAHIKGVVIHEYNHNDHIIGNIIHECNHKNENEYESSDENSDDVDEGSEYESSDEDSDDDSDDDSEYELSVENSSDDDNDFYIRTQCDWCYTNRCECNYPSDDSDDDTGYSDTDSDCESSEEEEDDSDEYNDTDSDCKSSANSVIVAVTMYDENNKGMYVSSDEEEEETDDEDSGVSYLSRGSTFHTYYGGEYFYDKNGDLHYCGQYDSDASDPGDDGIPDVISCSSNDDSSDDDDDDDSSYYESCDCEDPKCDCDAEMRYNQYKRKHQLENPELYELKFKLDNPTLFPRLHGYLQKVPKLRNYLIPKLNNDKYKQQMEELSEADDESDDGDNIINDGCNGYNNRRNYYNINNRYTLNNNNNVNHNDEAYVHNNNDYENHNDEGASIDSNSEDEESEDESEDESEGENGDISDVENDDANVNNFNNDNNDDRNNNVDDQDININQNDNNSVASGDGDIDNADDISVDNDTVNTTNNEDDSSVDTDNDNDDTDDDIDDSSGDDDEASIPKELQNYNAEGSYWSTNDRPSYATVAARSSDDNNESTDVTIGAIILPRTAKNQTLGLVSGTET